MSQCEGGEHLAQSQQRKEVVDRSHPWAGAAHPQGAQRVRAPLKAMDLRKAEESWAHPGQQGALTGSLQTGSRRPRRQVSISTRLWEALAVIKDE